MKKLLFIIAALLLVACEKDEADMAKIINKQLIGVWVAPKAKPGKQKYVEFSHLFRLKVTSYDPATLAYEEAPPVSYRIVKDRGGYELYLIIDNNNDTQLGCLNINAAGQIRYVLFSLSNVTYNIERLR